MDRAAAAQQAQDAPMNLKEDLKALLDNAGVPLNFQNFLDGNRCHTVKAFAHTAPNEEKFDPMVLEACGLELNFGDKVAIRSAFADARAQAVVAPSTGGSSNAPQSAAKAKLPDGAEQRCRRLWYERYHFHLPGGQLLSEDGGMGKFLTASMMTRRLCSFRTLSLWCVAQISVRRRNQGPS